MGAIDFVNVNSFILLTTLVVTAFVVRASGERRARTAKDDEELQAALTRTLVTQGQPVATARPAPVLPAVSTPRPLQLEPETLPIKNAVVQPIVVGSERTPKPPPATREPFDPLKGVRRRIDVLIADPFRAVPIGLTAVIVGLTLAFWGQSRMLDLPVPGGSYFVWIAGLLVLAVTALIAYPVAASASSNRSITPAPAFTRPRQFAAGFVIVSSVLIWLNGKDRLIDDPVPDLTLLWLASIAGLTIAVLGLPGSGWLSRVKEWGVSNRTPILLTLAVTVVALVPRLYQLTENPWAMSGDEGTFGLTARAAIEGRIRNPFNSGPWGYPTLLFMIQGWLMDLYGQSVGGARLMSALLGVGSVLSLYWLTKHHFGTVTALIAAGIGAAFHYHLFWSRNAQNAAAPMLFVPLALLFLDRGLIGRRRADCLAAGIVIGMAQFFHPGDRIIFPIAAAYTAYAVVVTLPRSWRDLVNSIVELVPHVFWVVTGAIVSHLPLLAYFSTHRAQFSDRTNQVSVFASGWLENEQKIKGLSAIHILAYQFKNAALLPFNTPTGGHYHPPTPFVGWPLVLPIAIGLAFVTIAFWQRRNFGLAVGFWAVTAGLALTDGTPQTNRYTTAAPFLAIFAAIGIVAVARILYRFVRIPRLPLIVVAAAVTGWIAWASLDYTFSVANRADVTSDGNTQIANQLAREAEALGANTTVYFAGIPQLSWGGFANMEFIAPLTTAIDLGEDEGWTPTSIKPAITGPTLFAFIPSRVDELAVIEAWFPNGELREHTYLNGDMSYVSYLVNLP